MKLPEKKNEEELVALNARAHDSVAANYDDLHIEIFNPTEQNRIREILLRALSFISTLSEKKKVLDFGAGTGNLTKHLLDTKVDVVAADLSVGCLEHLKAKYETSVNLQTLTLNGKDLSNIETESFDMISVYSVLHHIPDYLRIIAEFSRIVELGGIIYIDHEVCPSYWEANKSYLSYLKELGEEFSTAHLYELELLPVSQNINRRSHFAATKLLAKFIRHLKKEQIASPEPGISEHGDIHVYKHDHIEWDTIKARLAPSCDILMETDYLVCRERDEHPVVWEKWHRECVDMRLIIARKNKGN